MFRLDHVVPWGRSFEEYERMFALSADDLTGRILGCADGPASFNARASRQGRCVVSCDPLYRWSASQIRTRIAQTTDQILEQTRNNPDQFVWNQIRSIDELAATRRSAMDIFLADYEAGGYGGRYVAGELPRLPFATHTFDLALCSHFLFLYSDALGLQFHLDAAVELLRVGSELRVFPLLALGGQPSPHVDPVAVRLRSRGYRVKIQDVPYEFQRGGKQMMHVFR